MPSILHSRLFCGSTLQVACLSDASETPECSLVQVGGDGSPRQPAHFQLSVRNPSAGPWSGILRVGLESPETEGRFFLPGFLYGSNCAEAPFNFALRKQFPRLQAGAVAPPYAPAWHAASAELTHPVAAVFAGGAFLAVSVDPQVAAPWPIGFFCSVEGGACVGFTVGHRPHPGIYRSPFEFEEPSPEEGLLVLGGGAEVVIPFWLHAFAAESEAAFGAILENVYSSAHQPPREGADPVQTAADIATAAVDDAYDPPRRTFALVSLDPAIPADAASGRVARFAAGPSANERYSRFFEGGISWTNGVVIAYPLLQAAHRLGHPEWARAALEVIDDIVRHSRNPRTGIPYACKIEGEWTNRGWWTQWVESEGQRAEHPAYLVGQALFYIVKACAWEESTRGESHPEWLGFVSEVLERLAPTQSPEGAFPRFWSEKDGTGREYDAFAGCWVAAAMAAYNRHTGSDRWQRACEKAENHYYRHGVARMECSKTPLDVADAPDAEGILGYIRLARILHEKQPGPERLARLRTGLDYAFSFVFAYNVDVQGPPLQGHGWSSCGGSITSVCNAVVHCMTNTILNEIAYAWRQTNDPYLLARLRDIYRWGLQTCNRDDQEFFFGKRGWSTEYFCQAERYVLDIRLTSGERSNIWFAYHPWATAAILEGICGDLWEQREALSRLLPEA